jgi:hypothetical protein
MTETATPVWGSPSSEVKLEIGQIWSDEDIWEVIKVVAIGEKSFIYTVLFNKRFPSYVGEEHLYHGKNVGSEFPKLLPCWPPKKKVSKALVIYKDKHLSDNREYISTRYYATEEEAKRGLDFDFIRFAEWSREDFEE